VTFSAQSWHCSIRASRRRGARGETHGVNVMHDHRELTKAELALLKDRDLRALQAATRQLYNQSQRMAAFYERQSRGMAREITRRARNLAKREG